METIYPDVIPEERQPIGDPTVDVDWDDEEEEYE